MNKTKNVAWHKHLHKAKKVKENLRLAQKAGSSSSATPPPASTVRR